MKRIFLLIDENKHVVAIYDSRELAETLKPAIEAQYKLKPLKVEERALNPDLKLIGVEGMS